MSPGTSTVRGAPFTVNVMGMGSIEPEAAAWRKGRDDNLQPGEPGDPEFRPYRGPGAVHLVVRTT